MGLLRSQQNGKIQLPNRADNDDSGKASENIHTLHFDGSSNHILDIQMTEKGAQILIPIKFYKLEKLYLCKPTTIQTEINLEIVECLHSVSAPYQHSNSFG